MADDAKDKKVAVLTENGFEEIELTRPVEALKQAGVIVDIISPRSGKVKAWDHDHWSIELDVDKELSQANPEDYDMLLLPGGVLNPDKLRLDRSAISFAQHFLEQAKPVAAICHGPQLLIETGMLDGRTMTSYPAIRTDLVNAGVIWQDKEVVVDNGLVTSRSPKDLDAFIRKMLEELEEGRHDTTAQFTNHDKRM